jgi:hypothetical protein
VKDGRYTVQSSRNPTAGALAYFASQRSDQRLNRGPADICLRGSLENGIQRSLLRFVHRKGIVLISPIADNFMISQSAITIKIG